MTFLNPPYIFLLGVLSLLMCRELNAQDLTDTQLLYVIIDEYENYGGDKETPAWPTTDPGDRNERAQQLANWDKRLNQLNTATLTTADQVNRDMLALIIGDELFHLNFQSYTFPLNAEGGFIANIVYNVQDNWVDSEEALGKYEIKLRELPAYFNGRIADMRQGIALGKMQTRLVVENCIQVIDDVLDTPVEESFFLSVVPNAEDKRLIAEIVIAEVLPAYRSLRTFLQKDYLPQAPRAIGVSEMKDGRAFYEQRVRYFTTFDISPQAVFDQGMAEVERIRSEMEAIIEEVGFEGDFAAFLDFLRTDPQFYADSPQDLLDRAAWLTTKAQGQLPRFFTRLPSMPLDVVAVPAALAPNYTAGRYSGGSWEQQKPGQYWVNTTKLESRPLYVLPALTLHEGVPGHHLQIMLAGELEDLPKFRTNTYLSAFGEGWGLYAEHLGQEMGIYTTPYEQFGRLTYEMWRACRLVVDPGMHYFGWSRQQAVEFMATNTALSMHEVNTEINRYIGWPGQAVSYKIGELKIKALRQKAEEALGASFDLRAFHDVLLQNGSVPLLSLERIIDNYILEQ